MDLALAVALRHVLATSLLAEQPPAVTPSLAAVVVAVAEALSVATAVAVEVAVVAVAPRARLRRLLLVATRRAGRLKCQSPRTTALSSPSRRTTVNGKNDQHVITAV